MNLWPWRRREPCPSDEAVDALQQARRILRDTEARDQAVQQVTERLENIRRRNGFGEGLEQAMRRARWSR